MVLRSRLLLSLAAGLAAGLLAGCPAEQLGVELPRGGPDAISQEDLRRDAWMLDQAGDQSQAAGALARRLGEMRMLPGFGRSWTRGTGEELAVCGRKEGLDADALMVVATGDGLSARGTVAWAGLVSLAKGFDLPGQPDRTVLLCAVGGQAGLQALLQAPPQALDRLHRGVLVQAVDGQLKLDSSPPPFPELVVGTADPAPADLGAVDYRQVELNLRTLHARVSQD